MNSENLQSGEHVGAELSGYIDGELTQQQRQRIDTHCGQCPDCAAALKDLAALRAEVGAVPLSPFGEDKWREQMNDSTGRTLSGLGWTLLIGAILAAAGILAFTFLLEPAIAWPVKLVVACGYGGLAILLVAVWRQRLKERKSDKYKDVEI